MNNKTVIFFIFSSILLFSCSFKNKDIKRIYSYHYGEDYHDTTKWLTGIGVYAYQKNTNWHGDLEFRKSLYFNKDTFLYHIDLYHSQTSGEGGYLELILDRTEIQDEESLLINHTVYDSDKNLYVYIHYVQNYESEMIQLSTVYIEFSNDSLEYTRILSPSKELGNYYRNIALMYADSLELVDKLPLPDFSTCCTNLISSKYHFTECISKENNYYRDTYIDSIYEQGELFVDKEIVEYYSETKDSMGITKKYFSNTFKYSEEHYEKDGRYPIYKMYVVLDKNTIDTNYRFEMKSSPVGKGKLYTYNIIDNYPYLKEFDQDLRISISKREINILTNKYGKIISFHSIGYTNQGHKLELAYEGLNKKRIFTINNCTIPNISGDQIYDLNYNFHVYSDWFYYYSKKNYKKNTKQVKKRPSQILPFNIREDTKFVKKNKKQNYEKRISPDSLSIYNVYYYNH